MNPEIKARWVAALRSGDYKQTTNHLRTPVGFCCLGVLCDIHAAVMGEVWDPFNRYLDHAEDLPVDVQAWAGLDQAEPRVATSLNGSNVLSGMNDNGATFEQIADVIERDL